MKNFTCISVNHKLCGQTFRSLFTFDSAQCEKLLFDIKDLSPVHMQQDGALLLRNT